MAEVWLRGNIMVEGGWEVGAWTPSHVPCLGDLGGGSWGLGTGIPSVFDLCSKIRIRLSGVWEVLRETREDDCEISLLQATDSCNIITDQIIIECGLSATPCCDAYSAMHYDGIQNATIQNAPKNAIAQESAKSRQ